MLPSGLASVTELLLGLGVDLWAQPIGLLVSQPSQNLILSLAMARFGVTTVALTAEATGQVRALGLGLVLADRPIDTGGIAIARVDDSWFRRAATLEPPAPQEPGRILRVEFTSASTGTPKPIGLTGDAVYHQALNRITSYALSSPAALCLFRVQSNFGFGFALASLMQGRAIGFTDSNDTSIALLNYHRFATVAGSPAQVLTLAERIVATRRQSPLVDKVILAGGQVPAEDLRTIRLVFGGDIHIDYGASETGPSAFAAGALLSFDAEQPTVLVPHQEIAVATDTGAIMVRTTGMGCPYRGGVKMPSDAAGNGWFRPGDVGEIDSQGRLVLAGRADHLINVAGVERAPEVLESRLRDMSAIIDAAVAPATVGGEYVVAVVLRDGADLEAMTPKIQAALGRLKVNRLVRFAELPRTSTGKLDLYQLQGLLAADRQIQ